MNTIYPLFLESFKIISGDVKLNCKRFYVGCVEIEITFKV